MKPIIALAPMDGITDIAYRYMVWKYSPLINMAYTEFINVEGICKNFSGLIKKLFIAYNEKRVIMQVFGSINQLDYFYKAAVIAYSLDFDGIDLNMGCPDKNVMKQNAGASLIGDTTSVAKIIYAMREGINYAKTNPKKNLLSILPNESDRKVLLEARNKGLIRLLDKSINAFTISIKTRLGHNKTEKDSWWKFLDSLHLDFIAIHGRNVKQKYKGSANWAAIKRIKNLVKTPILGNGDISSYQDIKKRLQITPSGILIARGSMGNPYVGNPNSPDKDMKLAKHLMLEHAKLYVKYINNSLIPLRKDFHWYLKGIPNSAQLKNELSRVETVKDLKYVLSGVTHV